MRDSSNPHRDRSALMKRYCPTRAPDLRSERKPEIIENAFIAPHCFYKAKNQRARWQEKWTTFEVWSSR